LQWTNRTRNKEKPLQLVYHIDILKSYKTSVKEFDFLGEKTMSWSRASEYIVYQRICDYGVGADGSTKGKK